MVGLSWERWKKSEIEESTRGIPMRTPSASRRRRRLSQITCSVWAVATAVIATTAHAHQDEVNILLQAGELEHWEHVLSSSDNEDEWSSPAIDLSGLDFADHSAGSSTTINTHVSNFFQSFSLIDIFLKYVILEVLTNFVKF